MKGLFGKTKKPVPKHLVDFAARVYMETRVRAYMGWTREEYRKEPNWLNRLRLDIILAEDERRSPPL